MELVVVLVVGGVAMGIVALVINSIQQDREREERQRQREPVGDAPEIAITNYGERYNVIERVRLTGGFAGLRDPRGGTPVKPRSFECLWIPSRHSRTR